MKIKPGGRVKIGFVINRHFDIERAELLSKVNFEVVDVDGDSFVQTDCLRSFKHARKVEFLSIFFWNKNKILQFQIGGK